MNRRKQKGFTLIEILVAIVISILLLSIVMTVMTSSKRTYTYLGDMARLQENARFAMDFMGHGLRMGGYFGCAGKTPDDTIVGIQGADDSAFINNGAGTATKSDVLMVMFLDTDPRAFRVVHCPRDPNDGVRKNGTVAAPAACDPNPLSLNDPTPLAGGKGKDTDAIVLGTFEAQRGDLAAGDTVVAADCAGLRAFKVESVTATALKLRDSLNSTANGLNRDYYNQKKSYGAEMRKLIIYRYYLATNDDGETALYRDNGGGYDAVTGTGPSLTANMPSNTDGYKVSATALNTYNAEELIGGVENMQIRYGVDTNNDDSANGYYRATEVTAANNWDNVVSVRINLLLRTESRQDRELDETDHNDQDGDGTCNSMDSALGCNVLKYSDYRRRRIYSTTIEVRNNVK